MRIYLANAYTGREIQSYADISAYTMRMMKEHPEHQFFSPIAYGHPFTITHVAECREIEHGQWMELDLSILKEWADRLWIIGDVSHSSGVKMEIATAEEYGIPIRYLQGR